MIRIAALLTTCCLAACTSFKDNPPPTTQQVQQTVEVACFTLQIAHVAFQIFAAAKPGVFSPDDMSIEGAAIAGVNVFCTPPYDLSNYQVVVKRILDTAAGVSDQLSKANRA